MIWNRTEESITSIHSKCNITPDCQDLYETIEVLGKVHLNLTKGAHGIVTKVREKVSGLYYACKYIRSSDVEILENAANEYNILKMCDHPNIINVYDFNQNSSIGKSFLIMEYLPFQSLRSAIKIFKKENKFNESVIASIMMQILLALVYLHEELNIVHRDVKPGNILVSNNLSFVKLIDFGIASFYKKNSQNFKENKPSTLFEMMTPTGTPDYQAPEMRSGGIYTEKVDIWSCGVIIKEMLRGKRARDKSTDNVVPISESIEVNVLLKLLIKRKYKQRPTARQALSNPWFKLYTNEFIVFKYQKPQMKTLSSILSSTYRGQFIKFANFTDNSLSPSPSLRKDRISNSEAKNFEKNKLASIDNILEIENEKNDCIMDDYSRNSLLVIQSEFENRKVKKKSLHSIDEEEKMDFDGESLGSSFEENGN